MSEQGVSHPQPNYTAVFWSLFILTILEITAANLPVSKVIVVSALVGLAIVKAGLVALFYMHLKFEKLIIYLTVIVPIFLAIILTVLILCDKGQYI